MIGRNNIRIMQHSEDLTAPPKKQECSPLPMLPDVSDTENQQRSDHGLLFLQVCLFRIGK